ncbi:MAG: AAA family ATPase, partial [Candidatus Binatia bacterium]
MDVSGRMIAVEMKAGETIATDYFKNFGFWQSISGASRDDCFLVYAGDRREERRECTVLPWTDIYEIPL